MKRRFNSLDVVDYHIYPKSERILVKIHNVDGFFKYEWDDENGTHQYYCENNNTIPYFPHYIWIVFTIKKKDNYLIYEWCDINGTHKIFVQLNVLI